MPVHGRRSAPVRARWMEWIAFRTFTVLTTVVARHHEPSHDLDRCRTCAQTDPVI